MNETLKSIIGEQKKRRKPRHFRIPKSSLRMDRWYFDKLKNLVKEQNRQLLSELDEQRAIFNVANKAEISAFFVSGYLEKARKNAENSTQQAMAVAIAEHFVEKVNEENRLQVGKGLNDFLGVDVSPFVYGANKVKEAVERLTLQNVSLIKSLSTEQLSGVEKIMMKALTRGERMEEIAEQIQALSGLGTKRARFIARDQKSKAMASLSRARYEEIGINRYQWSTSGDERVRDTHLENDGLIFSFDDPPETGNPGDDFNCRCVAIPVIEGMNDKALEEEAKKKAEEREQRKQEEREAKEEAEALKVLFGDEENANRVLKPFMENKKMVDIMQKFNLKPLEAYTIYEYTEPNVNHYMPFNHRVRRGKLSHEDEVRVKYMRQGLSKLPAYQGTVWRDTFLTAEDIARYQKGAIVTERAFTSASRRDDLLDFKGNVRFEIESKTGRNLSELSSLPNEQEVLFKNDTKFKVRDVKTSQEMTTIILEEE